MKQFDLYSRIQLAPDAPASGADGTAGSTVSATGLSAEAVSDIADTLYGTPKDAPADTKTPVADTTKTTEPAAGDTPAAKTETPADPAPEEGAELTAEKQAELDKAIAEAGENAEAKKLAEEALTKAKQADAKFKEINAPFVEGKVVMPDGIEVDSALLKEFAPVAAELKLGQRAGQKLVDQFISIKQKEAAQHAETVKGWLDTAKSDPRLGKDNWSTTERTAQSAIEKHAEATKDQSLIEILNLSGLGNHPGMISFAAWAGAMIKDDTPVTAQNKASGKESVLDVLYPDAPKGTR